MRPATVFLVTLLLSELARGALGASDPPSLAVDRARMLIERHEFDQARILLEEALITADPADGPLLVKWLEQVYQHLIDSCERAGKTHEAAVHRENLAILRHAREFGGPSGGGVEDVQGDGDSGVQRVASTAPVPEAGGERRLPRMDHAVELVSENPGAGPSDLAELPPLEAPRASTPPRIESTPGGGEASRRRAFPGAGSSRPVASEPPANLGPAEPPPAAPAVAPLAGSAVEPRRLGERSPGGAAPRSLAEELGEADRLFAGKRYIEAGRLYARLAGRHQLPRDRNEVWAYCRWVAVVDRINAVPATDEEWDEIVREIRSVQRLTPRSWYGEYLLSKVAEARRSAVAPGRQGRLVIRGSEPDEVQPRRFPRLLGRFRSSPAPAGAGEEPRSSEGLGRSPLPPREGQRGESGGARIDDRASAGSRSGTGGGVRSASGVQPRSAEPSSSLSTAPVVAPPVSAAGGPIAWKVHETANFRILHTDSALAEAAAEAAERVRSEQCRLWGTTGVEQPWSPPCDLYLYPSAPVFARMTGQPEGSPGFSTLGLNGSRILTRRVNLRADHPELLTAILPHEVTHVVVADLFVETQIPRWADEGIAVLAEPATEQANRAADLMGPLDSGRVFPLNELMAIDQPDANAWSLYYAQSASLTQFFIQLESRARFIDFLKIAQNRGVEQALREVYALDGFSELEARWRDYARRQAERRTAMQDAEPLEIRR